MIARRHDGPDTALIRTPRRRGWIRTRSTGGVPADRLGVKRNQQISLVANPGFWGGKPGYDRLLIRHMSESAAASGAEVMAMSMSLQLIPEQVATLEGRPDISIVRYTSLDYLYGRG